LNVQTDLEHAINPKVMKHGVKGYGQAKHPNKRNLRQFPDPLFTKISTQSTYPPTTSN
jgi:hypothetical protein